MSGTARPDKCVRIIDMTKLTDDLDAERLLTLNELAVEWVDEAVAAPGMQV